MALIANRGDRKSRIWILMERPYESDSKKGYLLSGGMGFVLERMFREAGLDLNNCFVTCRRPDTDNDRSFRIVEGEINQDQPPFIIALGEAGAFFLPELKKKGEFSKGQLQKNAGSLLQSSLLSYPHYMMPMYPPDRLVADWTERNVSTYVDLQKLRDELAYFKTYGQLQPLPIRRMQYGDLELLEILRAFDGYAKAVLLSTDIETVYPRDTEKFKSLYKPHPGYPVTIGFASDVTSGLSFNLFRDDPMENRILWRALDDLVHTVPILGQNFFNFDALFFEALGYRISLASVKDTLLRHHILWPELSHKLQFMTRQYTREPYYKDEGHGWTVKNMGKLRRYNCLDVCVTMEIYLAQEEEFKLRPYLR